MADPRPLRLREPDGRYYVLELPAHREQALLQAAGGVASCAPESGARARVLERLAAGGPQAIELAVTIMREALA